MDSYTWTHQCSSTRERERERERKREREKERNLCIDDDDDMYVCMYKVLNYDIVVSEFKLQSRHYFNFLTKTLEKGMEPLFSQTMSSIVQVLFFYKDGFSIKNTTNIDVQTKKKNQVKPKYKDIL